MCAVSNNGSTNNFQVLLYQMLAAVSASHKHETKAMSAANAVYLARVLFQHFSESLTAVQLVTFSTDTPYAAADIEPSRLSYLTFLTHLAVSKQPCVFFVYFKS